MDGILQPNFGAYCGDIASLMNKAQVFPSSLTGNSEDATVQFFA